MAKLLVLIGTPSNGGGSVDSVFSRTGVVVAESGDYTTDQVTEGTNKYFPEAPNDGQEYARKSEGWVVVEGGVTSVNGKTGVVVLDGTDIELIDGGSVSVTQAISDLDNSVTTNTTNITVVSGEVVILQTETVAQQLEIDNLNTNKIAKSDVASKTVKGGFYYDYDAATSTLILDNENPIA